ncbi:MAG: PSD1 and planctomycete cytochrome C domain-containing protein, partial [Planctomycetia bacterium]|nr:PSD1 and planctomycete cytochrome C domain-containing protein [Planctomycetia bacterium]
MALAVWTSLASAGEPVNFRRDVLPILAEHCFACHGPDESARKAGLRVDLKEEALRTKDPVVVPGHSNESELIRRVASDDPDEAMPPPGSKKPGLSAGQVGVLRRWIDGGAAWGGHWSFALPRPAEPPAVRGGHWPTDAIDRFVLARLEAEGLSPSPAADRATLIRRAALDLTGLPPPPEDVDAFLADDAPGAYERRVDRLLASPEFGERMALDWLDAARYADSGGYQGDIFRTAWPWRDWVIAAFNRNLPFDRFTVEQLAGDLLPDPTRDQQVATGFNRNHRINDEDGIIPEEFRVEYVADRAETTASVWLGLTLGCARCHSHKYDPVTQAEYYAFFGFFNSVAETGRGHGNAPPVLHLTTPEQDARLAAIDARLGPLRAGRGRLAGDPRAAPFLAEFEAALAVQEGQRARALGGATSVMVMRDLEAPRDTFLLTRGAYDKPGARVAPGVPAVLPPLPAGAAPNRLGLARWLVDRAHPLTARVEVNRVWQMLFGVGLVATPEDFGVRGEAPSHPELLDWLAVEFVRGGWDVKALVRRVVTSATYRQSSRGTADGYRRDPENRLLARG